MVAGRAAKSVLGLENSIGYKLTGVFIFQAVKHAGAFVPSGDHPGHPHLRQVLRHSGLGLRYRLRKFIHGHLAVAQRQDQSDPRRFGKHRENLHGQLDILTVNAQTASLICIHANIMTHAYRNGPSSYISANVKSIT